MPSWNGPHLPLARPDCCGKRIYSYHKPKSRCAFRSFLGESCISPQRHFENFGPIRLFARSIGTFVYTKAPHRLLLIPFPMSGGGVTPRWECRSLLSLAPSGILLVDRREADHHTQREDGDARNVHEHEGQRSSTVSRELHGIHSRSPEGRAGVYGGVFCCRVLLDHSLCSRSDVRSASKRIF